MSSRKRPSLQDRIKAKQKEALQETFFGRGEEIARFREVLSLPSASREIFFFNAYGQGGVGKTFLLEHFRQIAEESQAITAWCDDGQRDLIESMTRLAENFRSKGAPLKSFEERLRTYRQKRAELESDPAFPPSAYEFLGRTTLKAGIWAAQSMGAGLALPFVDTNEMITKGGEFLSFLASKLVKKDDVQLVRDPVSVLTPLWLDGLSEATEKQTVVLFFDAYEHTSGFLDEWLCDILSSRYGETTDGVIFVIGGQKALTPELWQRYESFISPLPLDSFSLEETRSFLIKKGLTAPQVTADIFEKTKGLPVLVALLASIPLSRMYEDPPETAVGHFLKGVDPLYRRIALNASLSLSINKDILSELASTEQVDVMFDWMKRRPFVRRRDTGWEYHPVVRHLMLVYKRQESPEGWSELHRNLGDFHVRAQGNLGLSTERQWQEPAWRERALTVLYHRVCENPYRALTHALNGFLTAFQTQRAFALEWAEMLHRAEEDASVPKSTRWGEQLIAAVKELGEGRLEEAIVTLSLLIGRDELEAIPRAVALDWRGDLYRSTQQLENALSDYSSAIKLAPNVALYFSDRGRLLFMMRRYDESLTDFDSAIELDSESSSHLNGRSITLLALNRYAEAKADAERAEKLSPKGLSSLMFQIMAAARSKDVNQIENASRAMLDQSARLANVLSEIFANQPLTGFDVNGMASFHSILTGEPSSPMHSLVARRQLMHISEMRQGNSTPFENELRAGAAAAKAQVHQSQSEWQEALAAIEQAIQIAPDGIEYILLRARIQEQRGAQEDALADLNQAAVRFPDSAQVLCRRGLIHSSRGDTDLALDDFSKAIELEPHHYYFVIRSGLLSSKGQYREALADLERAIALSPENMVLALYRIPLQERMGDRKGLVTTCLLLGEHAPLVVQQLNQLVANSAPEMRAPDLEGMLCFMGFEETGNDWWIERLVEITSTAPDAATRLLRSNCLNVQAEFFAQERSMSLASNAINEALSLDPHHYMHWVTLSRIHRLMGRAADALLAIERARTLRPNSVPVQIECAQIYLLLKRHREALLALSEALNLSPKLDWASSLRNSLSVKIRLYAEPSGSAAAMLEGSSSLLAYSALHIVSEEYEKALTEVDALVGQNDICSEELLRLREELLLRLNGLNTAES